MVNGIPITGSPVYVQLEYHIGASVFQEDYVIKPKCRQVIWRI